MSFGYGVSDIITTSALAWQIYRTCKDSSDDFKNISSEVASLHVVLKEVEDSLSSQSLNGGQEAQLIILNDGCSDVLKDLDKLLKKYHSLGTKSQRTWDRMKWDLEDTQAIRERLTSNVTMFNAFNTKFILSSQARVEEILNQLAAEVRAGKREGSVISTHSIGSLTMDDKEAWQQFRKELEDIGISAPVLKQHQKFIITWFEKAVSTGALEEESGGEGDLSSMTSDRDNEDEPFSPDSTSDRAVDLDMTYRTAPNKQATAPTSRPAHQKVDPSTSDKPKVKKPRRTRLSYLMNKLFAKEHFFAAVEREDLEKIEELLTDTVLNVDCRNDDGEGALHCAAGKGRPEVVQVLLNKGLDIEAKDSRDRTALYQAASNGHLNVIALLLVRGANIEAGQDKRGLTPLYGAAHNGRVDAVELLLQKGADINAHTRGWTALHEAAFKGYSNLVELLLNKGADVDCGKNTFRTPLYLAAPYGNFDIVKLLLDKGADMNYLDGTTRMTPLDWAIYYGYTRMEGILRQYGAKTAQELRSDRKKLPNFFISLFT